MSNKTIPFYLRLRILRIKDGLTQDKLAELTGIPTHTISEYETSKHTPTLKNLEKLCKALNVNATKLLGF